MLKEGVIEPAMTKRAKSVVLAEKNDGKVGFCVDYRKLTAMAVRSTYKPLSRTDECTNSL